MNFTRKKVVFAQIKEGFDIFVRFNDGLEKTVDVKPFLNGSIFERVKTDRSVFENISIEGGTIAWETGADIDPYVLYYGNAESAGKECSKTAVSTT